MENQYIRFDEIEDVLSSIELVALLATRTKENPSYWKWIIVGAQNGLQGAMVSILAGTAGIDALTTKSAKSVLEWHDGAERPYPESRMAEFGVLLERCRKHAPDALLQLTEAEAKDISRLHTDFRNSFAHFEPMSWSIEKVGLPRIVGTAIDCVERLMSHERVSYKMSENRSRRLVDGIEIIRSSL